VGGRRLADARLQGADRHSETSAEAPTAVITPRRTRLVRVPDLRAFRRTVRLLSSEAPQDLFRTTAVVVPTRSAANQLAGDAGPGRAALRAYTRDELYGELNDRLAAPRRMLTPVDREVLLQSSAIDAISGGQAPPFVVRPGLVAEMLRFYDQLRRQGQTVARFDELIAERLAGDDDRGAARLMEQTRFLAASFRAYEERLQASGAVDEHLLRAHLMATEPADPLTDVVIAVGDWIADRHGLTAADFDLLTRIAGLERIDLVATDRVLQSGFHQRIHDWLPGLEEVNAASLGVESSPPPRQLVFPVSRDREEELVAVAKRIRDAERLDDAAPDLTRVAVVFERPLPYLYIAREVFGGAKIPYQTIDALPLAAEPVTAALDLAIEFASSQFSRDATLALLSSPHFSFGDAPLTPESIVALDEEMLEKRYPGELSRLRALDLDGNPAWTAAVAAADELLPLLSKASASWQLNLLTTFLVRHANDQDDERARRGRAALVDILRRLAAACTAHGDREATIDDLAPDIRRWIEEATFVPESGTSGG